MRANTMKQKLQAGQPVFGSMITFPSAPVVEMLGFLGYDWVLIDNEHGSITVDLAEDLIRAAEYAGAAPIVRPVGNRPEIIAPFLDRGAWGVQVPHVNTPAEARAAVSAVKYYPEGERGLFSRGRPAEYGFAGSTPDYVAAANRNTLVCLMLEEVEAIENIPELVQVPGVDVYFIGAGDLSQSMGYPASKRTLKCRRWWKRACGRLWPRALRPVAAAPTTWCRIIWGWACGTSTTPSTACSSRPAPLTWTRCGPPPMGYNGHSR